MAGLEAIFKLTDRYTKTMNNIDRATSTATGNILQASQSTDNLNNKLNKTSKIANDTSSGIRKLVGAVASLAAVQKGIQITDEYTNTKARLDLINDGMQTQVELQEKIFNAANRSRGAYGEMANAVSKMGLLAGDAFKSNDELIGFTELVQKSFKVSGADTSEQMGAMRQLTQAMASGRLQGDELVSIMENAPMVYDAIAKYMNLSKGKLKELSSEGAITSDILKNAMFMAADDINRKFETMPRTFGDVWNRIKNGATQAFTGVMDQVNNSINTDTFDRFVDGIVVGLYLIAEIASGAISMISNIASIFIDNWSWISPIIWGVVAALVVYNAILGIGWLITLKDTGAKIVNTLVSWAQHAAILALIAAQYGLNTALALCPITWIIVAVIMLIAVFYAAIAAINHFAGTSISATGIIVGVIFAGVAFIGNLFIAFSNLAIDVFVTIWNVVATFAEFLANVLIDPVGSIVRLFASLGDNVLGILEGIASAIDTIFGSNLAGAVSGWRGSLQGAVDGLVGKAQIEVPKLDASSLRIDRFDHMGAYDKGYNIGQGAENKIKDFSLGNLLNVPSFDIPAGPDPNKFLTKAPMGTKGNPATVKGAGAGGKVEVDISDEDLKYMRDIAERDYINKFSSATLAPNIEVTFGDVHEEVDIEKLRKRLNKILEEEIATAAEGAY